MPQGRAPPSEGGARLVTAPPPLLVARHAESAWNRTGRWQGRADPPLSDHGRAQARQLALALRAARPARVVSSDLRRAAETAAIVARELGGLPHRLDPRLREVDVGAWSGLTRREIERRWPEEHRRHRAGDPALRLGGGESLLEVRARARAALLELLDAGPVPLLAVVHGGVIRALTGRGGWENTAWIGLDPAELGAAGRAPVLRSA